ncbi:MAG: nitrous oxide reductase accessory protein NosL [Balneolaceae bacterium]|nr:nitrous oxide reductase accessory protein NosL [Balneolaceae bacterium]
MRGRSFLLVMLLASLTFITGCEPKPQPIEFGGDQCAYCRMMITEPEFGTQTLNNQGRSFKFDSIECMAAYELTNDDPENIHSSWVPDFLNRGEWLEARSALYLHSETLRSPMGLNLSSYENRQTAEEMRQEYGGEIISFDEVLQIVEQEWLSDNSHSSHGHH